MYYTSISEIMRGEGLRGLRGLRLSGLDQGDVDKMTYNFPPGHLSHRGTSRESSPDSHDSASGSWCSARADCGSSLGTLSSQGSIFSDSGDSLLGVRGSRRDWSPFPSESDLEEVRGHCLWTPYQSSADSAESEEEEQSSLRHQGAGRVPGETRQSQPDLPRVDRRRPDRRGDLRGAVPWGSYSSADRHRTQSPHRSEARSLNSLARRHWTQLGLAGRRQPGHLLRAPVLQYPADSGSARTGVFRPVLRHPFKLGVLGHPAASTGRTGAGWS